MESVLPESLELEDVDVVFGTLYEGQAPSFKAVVQVHERLEDIWATMGWVHELGERVRAFWGRDALNLEVRQAAPVAEGWRQAGGPRARTPTLRVTFSFKTSFVVGYLKGMIACGRVALMGNPEKQPVHEGPATLARLRALSLQASWLVDAVVASEIERQSCSPLEPSNSPGFKAWSTAFTTLAERLVPSGWAKVENRGLPRLVNRQTAVAVAVCHGDDAVGLRGREPRAKNPRGDQTILLVRSNQRQLNLNYGDEPTPERLPVPDVEEQITWWLLVFASQDGLALRAELSLPVGIDDHGFSAWEERIILSIPSNASPERSRDDEEPPLDIKVTVRPKV